MKRTDETLRRLLEAAAKAAPETAPAPPLGLETRVLATWRATRGEDELVPLFAFFRRATVGAGLVLALCAAWSLVNTSSPAMGDEAVLLDYDIQMNLNR